MRDRFRAPHGHVGGLLPAAFVIGSLIPAIAAAQTQETAAKASSGNESHALSACLDFADLHRAQKILGHKDRWARQLSDFEMAARQKTAEPGAESVDVMPVIQSLLPLQLPNFFDICSSRWKAFWRAAARDCAPRQGVSIVDACPISDFR